MFAAVRPRVAHLLQHSKQLLEMQVLLVCYHIQVLIKVIRFLTVFRRRKVARRIQRRAVRFQNDRRGQPLLVETHHEGPFALLEQVLLPQLIQNRRDFVIIKAFARKAVELYVQKLVYALCLAQREFLEPSKDTQRFFVPILDLFEPRPSLFVQALILLRFLMEAHIQLQHSRYGIPVDLVVVSPHLIGCDQFAELCSPIAEVVHAHHVIAKVLIYLIQRAANGRARKMADMKRLCDIDGRIIDHHRPARANLRPSPVFPGFPKHLEHAFRIEFPVVKEIKVSARHFRARHKIRRLDFFRQLLRDHRRRFSQLLCKLETRQRRVAHLRVGRRFYHFQNLACGKSRRCCNCFRKCGFQIHFHSSGTFHNNFKYIIKARFYQCARYDIMSKDLRILRGHL